MFFGGDQYNNHLTTDYILKCHVCGSQKLRYIGPPEPTEDMSSDPNQNTTTSELGTLFISYTEGSNCKIETEKNTDNDYNKEERVYICPSGHTTWGAIDQWDIKGQSDVSTSEVKDCCCEGRECDFPQSIRVVFNGILGVKAVEGNKQKYTVNSIEYYSYNMGWDVDIKSRFINPYRMCSQCMWWDLLSDDNAIPTGYVNFYFGDDYFTTPGEVNGPVYYYGTPLAALNMWPYRVPTFRPTFNSPLRGDRLPRQLYYNKTKGVYEHPTNMITPGMCQCLDNVAGFSHLAWNLSSVDKLFCGDPTYGYLADPGGELGGCFPECSQDDRCFPDISYSPCLEKGTHKCFEVDARYRVPCGNPADSFTIEFESTQVMSASFVAPTPATVLGSSFGNYCTIPLNLNYPVNSTNFPADCASFTSSVPAMPVRAYGPACQVMAPQITKVDQPHCTRRVKQAGMSTPYYSVNTADLSNQVIILDRVYTSSSDHEYLWEDNRDTSQAGSAYIEPDLDLGFSEAEKERLFPFPWIANSGSLEEPELVAIIHSEKGKGGQIAFETFPVSIDTPQFADPIDPFDREGVTWYSHGPYTCGNKLRVRAHGYGVKYPSLDDPIWTENDIYEYPVFLKGQGYKEGDKIEFRCWKQLFVHDGEDSRVISSSELDNPELTEDPRYQQSKEIIVATATITEVDANGGIIFYEFDPFDDDGIELRSIGNAPCQYDLCGAGLSPFKEETLRGQVYDVWDFAKVATAQGSGLMCPGCMSKELYPSGTHPKIDALPQRFVQWSNPYSASGIPGFPNVPNGTCIYTETYLDPDYLEMFREPLYDICEYTDGPPKEKFYESNNFRSFFRLGICDSTCAHTAVCNVQDYAAALQPIMLPENSCQGTNCYCDEALEIGCRILFGDDWEAGCAVEASYGALDEDLFGEDEPSDGGGEPTEPSDGGSGGSGGSGGGGGDPYGCVQTPGDPNFPELYCFCPSVRPRSEFALYETIAGTCRCNTTCPGSDTNLLDAINHNPSPDTIGSVWTAKSRSANTELCYPKNRTWEWHEPNYGLSSCFGEALVPELRPYYSGNVMMAPREAQYRYVWLAKPKTTLEKIEEWLPKALGKPPGSGVTAVELKEAKVAFLESKGCNPLELDLYDNSYKYPLVDLTENEQYHDLDKPCRTQNKDDGLRTLYVSYNGGKECTKEPSLLNDGYCRVYGFYQQRSAPCDVVYKGQYILRSTQREFATGFPEGTDCEPIIEDLTITLKKKEAKFDIAVGAPYSQDHLIPEQLPGPIVGPDGKLEATADAWNSPSKEGISNVRLFNHGYYEIERKQIDTMMYIPPTGNKDSCLSYAVPPVESAVDENGELPKDPDIPQTLIVPDTFMYPVDYNDLANINTYFGNHQINLNQTNDVWDFPDPRSNIRIGTDGLDVGDLGTNPTYTTDVIVNGLFPSQGTRASFIESCPYPWENLVAPESVDYDDSFFYCMFENHSAEIKLGSVKECPYCSDNELLYLDGNSITFPDSTAFPAGKGYLNPLTYTYRLVNTKEPKSAIIIRCYGVPDLASPEVGFSIDLLADLLNEYITFYTDLFDLDRTVNRDLSTYEKFLVCIEHTEGLKVLSNMIFGTINDQSEYRMDAITKFELLQQVYDGVDTEGKDQYVLNFLHEEARCEDPKVGGSIEHLLVENGGAGYAFEVEERVAPTGTAMIGNNLHITLTCKILKNNRRREEYTIDNIVSISGVATGYEVGDIIQIKFDNEPDARRDGVQYDITPTVRVDSLYANDVLDPNDSTKVLYPKDSIEAVSLDLPGSFYKYAGTGVHRAFPIAVIVDNYWNDPRKKDSRETKTGRNAMFRPVVGVDPTDPATYGKIKRIEIEYGGVGYVEPNTYWMIHTEAGKKDEWGDLISGLDIQHLADPTQYCVRGNGLTPYGMSYLKQWLNEKETRPFSTFKTAMWTPNYVYDIMKQEVVLPDRAYPGKFTYNENGQPQEDLGADFTYADKYYYKTHGNQCIKWSDRALGWSTIIEPGICPFGPGGLLDRTYKMALVEEVDVTSQGNAIADQPYTGNCPSSTCNEIVNNAPIRRRYNTDPGADGAPYVDDVVNGIWLHHRAPNLVVEGDCEGDSGGGSYGPAYCTPDVVELGQPFYYPYYSIGGDFQKGSLQLGHAPLDLHYLPCDIFTAYDAHRYAMIGENYSAANGYGLYRIAGLKWNDWDGTLALERPLLNGCPQRQNSMAFGKWCFGSYSAGNESLGTGAYGWIDFSEQMQQDNCYNNTEYSLFGEYMLKQTLSQEVVPAYRATMITYKMANQDITMTVSSNDPTQPIVRPACGNKYCIKIVYDDLYEQVETITSNETYAEICERYCGDGGTNQCSVKTGTITISEGECTNEL